MSSEETAKLISASGTSEVSGAAKFTTSVRVSDVAEAAVMLFLGSVDNFSHGRI